MSCSLLSADDLGVVSWYLGLWSPRYPLGTSPPYLAAPGHLERLRWFYSCKTRRKNSPHPCCCNYKARCYLKGWHTVGWHTVGIHVMVVLISLWRASSSPHPHQPGRFHSLFLLFPLSPSPACVLTTPYLKPHPGSYSSFLTTLPVSVSLWRASIQQDGLPSTTLRSLLMAWALPSVLGSCSEHSPPTCSSTRPQGSCWSQGIWIELSGGPWANQLTSLGLIFLSCKVPAFSDLCV